MRRLAMMSVGLMGMVVSLAAGCSSTVEETDEGTGAVEGQTSAWAVDMKKVSREYGDTSKYFFGLAAEESDLKDIYGAVGQKIVWDQTFHRGLNHEAVTEGDVAVILEDGTKVKTEGYVNIVPLLKDTDPTKQVHLRKVMKDGDILVYFHPEYTDTANQMERRASHVAMHYDYKAANGREYVHHIDNPNGYGPQYNHEPSRQMPFHVFRFKPKANKQFKTKGGADITINAELAAAYGKSARNYGFMDNDTTPFADFFTLNLKTKEDLTSFVRPAVEGQDLPELYCSGLAYTNLNLALNFPKNQAGLGSMYSQFSNKRYEFSDTNEQLSKSVLEDPASVVSLDRLIFPPYAASDIVNSWVDAYLSKLPMPVRQQVLSSPDLQQQIVYGLQQLAWSGDNAKPSARRADDESEGPANPQNAARFAKAYGQPASATAAYLAADPELKAAFDALGVPAEGKTPMEVFKAVEEKNVTNKFVPPRIWMDDAEREDSDLVYVATVLNCEMLSAKDGSSADACSGGNLGSAEFREGAADTTTYPDYKIGNGKEISHRKFSVTSGPEQMGKGTVFNVRASSANIDDVKFVVHTPDMWKGHPLEGLGLVELARKCNELYGQGKVCSPDIGIKLDPAKAGATGPLNEGEFTFNLADVCQLTSETKMTCPVMRRGADNKWTDAGTQEVARSARGSINATMIDFGANTTPASFERCDLCSSGGGHYNGWNVILRNDD
jgi:hypothetical protein